MIVAIRNRPFRYIYVIVLLRGVTIIKDLFKPLQKLKVILILAFDKFLDFNVFHDSKLGEILLKYFEVINVLVVIFGFEIDLAELYFPRVQDIEHLTVDGTSP